MVSWESFKDGGFEENIAYVKTDITCPKCGKLIYMNKRIVLTSYPPKYIYECSCGWNDISNKAWR